MNTNKRYYDDTSRSAIKPNIKFDDTLVSYMVHVVATHSTNKLDISMTANTSYHISAHAEANFSKTITTCDLSQTAVVPLIVKSSRMTYHAFNNIDDDDGSSKMSTVSVCVCVIRLTRNAITMGVFSSAIMVIWLV